MFPREDPLSRALAAEIKRQQRRAARHARWRRFVSFWIATAAHLKTAAAIVASLTALAGAAVRVWQLVHARDVGRAELPATGVPSTTPDYVPKP